MHRATISTVGHTNRSVDELLALLDGAGIETIVDVRSYPRSRRCPQFDEHWLRSALEASGKVYHWAGRQLGGLRRCEPDSPHIALAKKGLRGFADYMDREPFARAAARLVNIAYRAPTAILCAERLPQHCHRSLIADYLSLQGLSVVHLVAPTERREHHLRAEARRGSGGLIYDRHTTSGLGFD